MRYAAKRTWPERPEGWEHHGEADSLEGFALAFATDRRLGVGTEFEVLDKDSDDAALVSFRVASTIPYTLGPVQTHAKDQPPTNAPPPIAASALSFVFYMAKVAVVLIVVMGGIFTLLKMLNLTNPPG